MSDTKPIATRDGYGKALIALGKKNPNVVVIDADLGKSTRSNAFGKEFPDRYFNVGISEQDMVVCAAGLASCGKISFANTFAIFSERAFEQIRNSLSRMNANVKVIGSHGGIQVGEDGTSAQCIEDFAVYRSLPNMVVLNPCDAVETEKAVYAIAEHNGPVYIRLTRDKLPIIFDDKYKFQIGKGVVVRKGKHAVIFATGALVPEALKAAEILAAEKIEIIIVNIHTIKPLDEELVVKLAKETGVVITAEDHNIIGGLGTAVADTLAGKFAFKFEKIGLKDSYAESGTPQELYKKYGLSSENIAENVRRLLKSK